MHRGLPEGNTKLVLILARLWALPTIGSGLHEFLPDPTSPIRASRSLHRRHSCYELYMYAYDMPIKCT